MNYVIQSVDTHFPSPISSYSSYSTNYYNDMVTVDVSILIQEHNSKDLESIENFEKALKGHKYPWLTDKMLENAVKKEYPEYFL